MIQSAGDGSPVLSNTPEGEGEGVYSSSTFHAIPLHPFAVLPSAVAVLFLISGRGVVDDFIIAGRLSHDSDNDSYSPAITPLKMLL